MTTDAVTTEVEVKDDYWPRVIGVSLDASLHDRRVHIPDVTAAAELAVQAFRTALESRGYRVEVDGEVTYGYRALKEPLGWRPGRRLTRKTEGETETE